MSVETAHFEVGAPLGNQSSSQELALQKRKNNQCQVSHYIESGIRFHFKKRIPAEK